MKVCRIFLNALIVGIAVCYLRAPVVAAEFLHTPLSEKGSGFIMVVGRLELGDEKKFNIIAQKYNRAAVVLSSPGGSLIAGIKIGQIIRTRNFATGVAPNTLCASACALAWLGGTSRYISSDSRVGFHAASVVNNGTRQESRVGNAIVGAYVNSLALPTSAVVFIVQAGPSDITWLTASGARRVGIDVEFLELPPFETDKSAVSKFADTDGPKSLEEIPPLGSNQQWLIVASRTAFTDAKTVAEKYKSEFPETMIMVAANGQYAITLGRFVRDQFVLDKLKEDGRVPQDAYFSKGARLDSIVWR